MISPKYRVVVADDVAQLRTLLGLVLERSGRFEVVAEAANGAEAVAAATETTPDLTLLDLSMPVMDGLEALPQVRAAVPSCVVVVLSGFDADRMESRALDAGAAAYLVKGIAPDDLVARLLELLDGRDGQPGPADPPHPPAPRDTALQLPRDLGSASAARRFLTDTLSDWSRQDLIDDATLLATELVTNAVVHAESSVRLRVTAVNDHIRIEVADTGRGALTLKAPSSEATGGRGLLLVEALARSWGTSADNDEKLVWFEV